MHVACESLLQLHALLMKHSRVLKYPDELRCIKCEVIFEWALSNWVEIRGAFITLITLNVTIIGH